MNKKSITVFAFLLTVALPVAAQIQDGVISDDFENARAAVLSSHYYAEMTQHRAESLSSALGNMNDGGIAGGRVLEFMHDHGLSVSFADQNEAVKTSQDGKTILLSKNLPPAMRVYVPLIASEVAKQMYADMMPCGERSYMIMATAARAFTEVGGDMKILPKIDEKNGTVESQEVNGLISLWMNPNLVEVVNELADRDGVNTLGVLYFMPHTREVDEKIREDFYRFRDFVRDQELDYRKALGLPLPSLKN